MPAPDRTASSRIVLLAVAALVLTLAVRLFFVRHASFCGVPDSCSYLALAQTLSTTHTFQQNFLDDLQLRHLALPATGIEYWRPGTSFFFLLAQPVGVTLRSSLVITIFAGLLAALAAWRFATHLALSGTTAVRTNTRSDTRTDPLNDTRTLAALSVLLCFAFPPFFSSSLIPDSGLFYAAAVAWFLALLTPRSQGVLADTLALLCVAVAYLIRNDAVLLLIPLLTVLYLRRRAAGTRGTGAAATTGSSPAYLLLLLLGFFVALAPMHLIDRAVLGTAFPEAASRALFLDQLSDLQRYGDLRTAHSLLGTGIVHLVKQRVGTAILITYRLLFVVAGFAVVFLPLLFLNRSRATTSSSIPAANPPHDDNLAPETALSLSEIAGPIAFLAAILVVYSVFLPAIGVFSALRASFGLLPVLAVVIILAMRRFLPHAWPTLAFTVALFYIVSGVMADKRDLADSSKVLELQLAKGRVLLEHGASTATAVVLTPDAPQLTETTGFPSAQLATNGLAAIAREAADLHATHIFLAPADLHLTADELAASLNAATTPAAIPGTDLVLLTLRHP